MPDIAHSAHDMIAGMSPEPQPGRFVFVSTPDSGAAARLIDKALGLFRESEGVSLLLPVDVAQAEGFPTDHPMRCITLNVYSALDGVGLTAAVAAALAAAGIPCNMVAAHHHDHVFVPEALLDEALTTLKALQDQTRDQGTGP